ncbi:MAG: hypothetical protein V3W41_18655 [Planctomycetota bacterium]
MVFGWWRLILVLLLAASGLFGMQAIQDTLLVGLPESQFAAPSPASEKPVVVELTRWGPSAIALSEPATRVRWTEDRLAVCGKMLLDGQQVSFKALHDGLVKKLGSPAPGSERKIEESKQRLSECSVLIRCDRGRSFDYVMGVIRICMSPKVAVSKIQLAVAGEEGPVICFGLRKELGVPGSKESELPFVTVHLDQALRELDNRPIRERVTLYRMGSDGPETSNRHRTLLRVGERLAKFQAVNADGKVRLAVGPGVSWRRVVGVHDVIRAKGFEAPLLVGFPKVDLKAAESFQRKVRKEAENRRPAKPKRPRRSFKGTDHPVLDGALEWLGKAQKKRGFWTTGAGDEKGAVSATALALLAFAGEGTTHRVGSGRGLVRGALSWLKSQQRIDGGFSPDPSQHALATLAFCEIYRLTKSPVVKGTAQKGLGQLQVLWRERQDHDVYVNADAEFFAWSLLAFRSARTARLSVSDSVNSLLGKKLEALADAETGKVAGDKRFLMTTVVLLSQLYGDSETQRNTARTKASELLGARLPSKQRKADMHHWLFGTILAYNVGGELWRRWHATTEDMILNTQNDESLLRGSWDPKGRSVAPHDRATATALAAICLEIGYGFGLVVGVR